MQAIRVRLTTAYSLALAATMAIFAAAVYSERKSSARQEADARLTALLEREADIANSAMSDVAGHGASVVVSRPSFGGVQSNSFELREDIRGYFGGVAEYLFVTDER